MDCLSSRTVHYVALLVWLLSFIGMHLKTSQVARLCLILFNSEVHSIVMNVSLFALPFTSCRVFGFMAVFLSSLKFFFYSIFMNKFSQGISCTKLSLGGRWGLFSDTILGLCFPLQSGPQLVSNDALGFIEAT